MRFLKSKYPLILLLAVLGIELIFRIGLYEPLVSPYSHSGTTITVKRALAEFGADQVDVVTLGDSRGSQGLDNNRVYKAGREFGLNHLKLSMAGSHLMTYKALASWSLDELDELQGIVITVSPASFANLGNGAYELAKVMPLRNDISTREMFKHVPFRSADIRTFAPLFSIAGYRDDIKDLLVSPAKRFQAVKRRNGRKPLSILAYTGKDETDICAVPTADPDECLRVLQQEETAITARARGGLETLCKAAKKDKKNAVLVTASVELADEWVSFLENLSSGVRVMLLILPDYGPYKQHLYSAGSMAIRDAIVKQLNQGGLVDVVDLHEIISLQGKPECGFYLDSTHLNLPGKRVLTDALMPPLEAFWRSMQ